MRRPPAAAAFRRAAAALALLGAAAAGPLAAHPAACAIMPGSQLPAGLAGAPADSLAGGGEAAEVAPDAGAPASPRPERVDAAADGARAERLARIGDVRLRPRFDRPRWVMLRSVVFPGWGQAHNRAWFKALAVASLEGWMIVRIVDDERDLGGLLDDVDRAQQEQDPVAYDLAVNAYNSRFDASVSRRWLLGAVIAYAMLDAYVDAHFVDFGVQFERDPALPGGPRPAGFRLGLRGSW